MQVNLHLRHAGGIAAAMLGLQSRRNRQAAKRSFRKLLNGLR